MHVRFAGCVVALSLLGSGCAAPAASPAPATPVQAPASVRAEQAPASSSPLASADSEALHAQALAKLNAGDAGAAATLLEQAVNTDASQTDIREGALWSGLVDGRQIFLHAHDEREWNEKNSWCGAVEGKVGHGGTYAWYVEPAPGETPVRQPFMLTSQWAEGRPVSFNGGMPTVSTLPIDINRTLLILWQPVNCNFKEIQAFGWDDHANQLVQYGFQFEGESKPTYWPAISGDPFTEDGYLKTQSYNNAKGEWTYRTWELRGTTFVNVRNEIGR